MSRSSKKKSRRYVEEITSERSTEKLRNSPSFKQVMENIRKERKKKNVKHEGKNRTSR